MNFIKLPSGDFVNLDVFSSASPKNIEFMRGASVTLDGITLDRDVVYTDEDAKYIFAYLEYMRRDTISSGFNFK